MYVCMYVHAYIYVHIKLMRRFVYIIHVSQLTCIKPAGMAANEDSIEALTLQEHYTTLVEGLEDLALPVASSLYSRRQINFQELKVIQQINLTPLDRSQALVNAVQDAIIFEDTKIFSVFVEVLEERGCASSIVDKLRSTYGTYCNLPTKRTSPVHLPYFGDPMAHVYMQFVDLRNLEVALHIWGVAKCVPILKLRALF